MKKFLVIMTLVLLTGCGIPNAKNTGEENTQETVTEETSPFCGEWVNGGNVIDIYRYDSGEFHCEVTRPEKDDSAYFWSFDAILEGEDLKYTECVKTIASYDEEGEVEEEVIYRDGTGSISLKGDKLVWNDEKENAAAGLEFSYEGEY